MNHSDLVSVRRLGQILGFSPEILRRVAKDADGFYHSFQIHRDRAKPRKIDQPLGILRRIQSSIKSQLLDQFEFPGWVNGGVKGRSLKTNAQPHVRQNEVVNLDIKNFYGTVTSATVAQAWKKHFCCGNDVQWLLTRLTTFKGHIPQGCLGQTKGASSASSSENPCSTVRR
jgi:RNA-directed DNA polymerase